MYLLSRVLWEAARPSMALLLLTLVGFAILIRTRNSRYGFIFLAAGVAGFAACAFLPLGTWLLRPLEDRFPPIGAIQERVDGIVLLGGAIDLQTSMDRGMPALNMRAERVIAFVALARRFPYAQLLFTGGNAITGSTKRSEADVARVLTASLGIPPQRVKFERMSRNTRENALLAKRLARPMPGQRWLLVTSAADMPRAVGCFRAVGWPVVPVPVDYHTGKDSAGLMPGLVGGLEAVDWAAHEWIGLVYYRAQGWTPALFPGPEAEREIP
jgi:uncharacterized SAM-binding protein YcdF (DUF218 family)